MLNYKIETIAEHSCIPSLFDWENAGGVTVLDCGCRGFEFTKAMGELGAWVWSIDCDELEGDYIQAALSDREGIAYLKKTDDPQATRIVRTKTEFPIDCITLAKILEITMVKFFDLIKLDIEGSEFEVIMSLDKAPAKQLSIEFHLHTGIYGWLEMVMMEDKLKSLGYETIQHNLEERHGCTKNYWDSLFVLK